MGVNELKQKIAQKKAVLAVIGLGYVGLPLAVSFAKAGFKVYGLDKNSERADRIRNGKNYNEDVSLKDIALLLKKKIFDVSTNLALLERADVIIICVPTPLKSKYTPDVSYIWGAVKTVCQHLRPGKLIILESTTYPGTTEEFIKPLLEKGGLKAGKDFYLAFSPERIDPGNKKHPVTKIPKIVGGLDAPTSLLAKTLYEKVVSRVHVVSSARAAEMTKLLENTFRLVNISWVNEAMMMCHKMGIDIWEVIDAAKTKPFGFMPFYPSLGVGGHCIPDDPLYLYWKAKHHGISSKFIKLSADTNDKVPHYVLSRLQQLLRSCGVKGSKARILVVGVTYKKDVKDLRRSPALTFIELLKKANYHVSYFDPLVSYLKIDHLDTQSIKLTAPEIRKADCVIMAVAHTDVDYALILKEARLIFDLCNIYAGKKEKIHKL
jgi:UDP-N-acetyl-D-glucosamine dehydrogenase